MSRALVRLAFVVSPVRASFGALLAALVATGVALAAESSTGTRAEPSAPPTAGDLEAACGRGDQAACTAFGYEVASQRAFPPDLPRAFDLWRRGCEAGHLPACIPYGEVLLRGYAPGDGLRYVASLRGAEAITPHRWKARRVLSRACDAGQARACDILGLTLIEKKLKHDDACLLFGRACRAGDSGGCWDQVRSCHRHVAVTLAEEQPPRRPRPRAAGDFRAAAFAVDPRGALLVEDGGAAGQSRVARVDTSGRLTWLGAVPSGLWRIADCADGRTAWLADGRRLFHLAGANTLRPVALPASTLPAEAASPELTACLADGSVVVARALSAAVTDEDYRLHVERHPGLLDVSEVATLQKLALSVYPSTRPREVEQARALATRLASDLRAGKGWQDVVRQAKEAWYWVDEVASQFSPAETPTAGAPPREVFSLPVGQIEGPLEQLEPAPQGRLNRWRGAFTLWRVVSHTPARAPAPERVVAQAKAELPARIVELLIVTPTGTIERQRLPVISTSRVGDEGQVGPLVPLADGGFALLGVDRGIWKARQWTTDAPLLRALGDGPVLDAVRDGRRLAVLTDARVRVFDLAGNLQGEAPRSRVADGAFYPRRIGVADAGAFLLVSPNLQKVDVLALDANLAIRWVDTLPVDGNDGVGRSAVFAPSGLWLLAAAGRRLTAHQGRQVVDYELGP